MAEWKKSLDTGMSSYVAASVQAGASEDEAKKKPVYVQAQAVKGSLETLQSELGRTKETIEWGENQFKSAEGGGEGTALPKAVSDMLDDAFCGQFFKAVSDIHKGKGDGGLNDFQTKSQQAADNTASLHGHVAESGADKVARRAGNVSTVTGIVGAGTDTLSAISDFNSEKDELNKHDENFRAASAFFSTATGAVNTVSDAVGTGAEAHALRKQEEARRAKIKAMAAKNPDTGVGKAHASDHAGRADIAGQAAGELGGLVGMGSAIAGGFNSKNDTAGTVNSALGVGASGLGAMSDLFGMSVDSAKADQARKQDMAAKNSMRALGKQLEGTLPRQPNPDEKRPTLISAVCQRLTGKKFNAEKGENKGLSSLITQAISGEVPGVTDASEQEKLKKPDLTGKQSTLLSSIQALEDSRASSKDAASSARRDVVFDLISMGGNLLGLAGNIVKLAGGSGIVGTALSLAGSLVGLIGKGREAHHMRKESAESRQEGRDEERDQKVKMSVTAVNQIAALPPLQLETLQQAKKDNTPLLPVQVAAAEQYAAVFNMIRASGVEMADLLYAIDMGGFGSETASGQKKSAADSLKDMYANLSFTS